MTEAPYPPGPSLPAPVLSRPPAGAPDPFRWGEDNVIASRAAVRPQVLALPSATVTRSVALILALLSSGLFVGNAVHHSTSVGDTWFRTVSDCFARLGPGQPTVAGVVSSGHAIQHCTAHVNAVLIWFQIAGIVLAALISIGLAWSAPVLLVRLRGLRTPAPGLTRCVEGVHRLAAAAGLRRPPRVWIGRTDQRDAFTFGRPGRYSVSLPPALAVRSRNPDRFDPVIRHELQHIRRRDVLLGWTALVSRRALIPLLCVPIIFELAHSDTSVLPSYLWRAALLAVTGLLASATVLRAREFEADLASADGPQQRGALRALLGAPQPTTARWRRLLAAHPSQARRRLTIDEPIVLTRLGGLDGFVVGLISALTMPMVTAFLSDSSSLVRWSAFGGPLIAGALLGVTVGLGTWRAALAHRAVGAPPPSARALLVGVFVGFLLGQTSSLAEVGSTGVAGFDHSSSILLNPIGAVSAAALVVAGSALFADTAPALGRRLSALLCLVVSAGLFVGALWLTNITQPLWGPGGWRVLRAAIVTLFGTDGHVVLAGIVAASVLVILALGGRSTGPPRWAYDGPPPTGWPSSATRPSLGVVLSAGVLAGIGGWVAIALFRWQAGAATDSAHLLQRADMYVWIFGLSGVAAMVVLALRYRGSGLAAGLAAGPIAAAVAAVLLVVQNTALGGALTWTFTSAMLRGGLGVYCGLLIPVGISWCVVEIVWPSRKPVPSPGRPAAGAPRRPARALAAVAAAALVLGAALSGALIADREQVSPLGADQQDIGSLVINDGSSGQSTPQAIATYRNEFAPQAEAELSLLDRTSSLIAAQTGLTNLQLAELIETDLITPIQHWSVLSAAHQGDGEPIRSANQELLTCLAHELRLYQAEVSALAAGASSLPASTQTDAAQAVQARTAWEQAVAALK